MNNSKEKLLIVQRVIMPYRLELIDKLSPYFKSITIISSYGGIDGAGKAASTLGLSKNVVVRWLKSISLPYSGESRSWSFVVYPQSVLSLFKADIILLEGTTNLVNNIYLVPIAWLLRKKIIWWDAGYSPEIRTARRVKIDALVSKFIGMTDKQIAYSSKAKKYMEQYMGANDCSLVLNTVSTSYFNEVKQEVLESINSHQLDNENIKLLYVGAVEERKKVMELINLIAKINSKENKFYLVIIGDGNYLETCKKHVHSKGVTNIEFAGRIYDKDSLKPYYFSSDLLVMPGDGGLAIAQSLLFGLPAVCMASDGTEYDYISNEKYLLKNFDELNIFLETFSAQYDRTSVLSSMERLQDNHFVTSILKALKG